MATEIETEIIKEKLEVIPSEGLFSSDLDPSVDHYRGEQQDGLRNGFGKCRYANGSMYKGHWVNDKKDGLGVFTYPDGSRYDGEWADDKRHGYGKYYYPNGDIYEGEWQRHHRHGHGSYVYTEHNLQYSGVWVKGRRDVSRGSVTYVVEPDTEKTEFDGGDQTSNSTNLSTTVLVYDSATSVPKYMKVINPDEVPNIEDPVPKSQQADDLDGSRSADESEVADEEPTKPLTKEHLIHSDQANLDEDSGAETGNASSSSSASNHGVAKTDLSPRDVVNGELGPTESPKFSAGHELIGGGRTSPDGELNGGEANDASPATGAAPAPARAAVAAFEDADADDELTPREPTHPESDALERLGKNSDQEYVDSVLPSFDYQTTFTVFNYDYYSQPPVYHHYHHETNETGEDGWNSESSPLHGFDGGSEADNTLPARKDHNIDTEVSGPDFVITSHTGEPAIHRLDPEHTRAPDPVEIQSS